MHSSPHYSRHFFLLRAVDLTRVTVTSKGVNILGIHNKSSLSRIEFK